MKKKLKTHSQNVAGLSLMLAKNMNLTLKEQQKIYKSGLLHDIGKIFLPERIIYKKSALTKKEFNIIKLHPILGYNLLKYLDLDDIAENILYHHENFNGSGYPENLKSNEIPIGSQIISITDAWNVMLNKRCYKKNTFTFNKALSEIVYNTGTQFSPQVSNVFINNIKEDSRNDIRF